MVVSAATVSYAKSNKLLNSPFRSKVVSLAGLVHAGGSYNRLAISYIGRCRQCLFARLPVEPTLSSHPCYLLDFTPT